MLLAASVEIDGLMTRLEATGAGSAATSAGTRTPRPGRTSSASWSTSRTGGAILDADRLKRRVIIAYRFTTHGGIDQYFGLGQSQCDI